MAFGFHSGIKGVKSALARLVTRVGLIDDVDLATTANDLAVRVTLLGGFNGGNNFHKKLRQQRSGYPTSGFSTRNKAP